MATRRAKSDGPSPWTVAAIAIGATCWLIGTLAGFGVAGAYDADQARYLGFQTPSLQFAIIGGLLSLCSALLGIIVGGALVLAEKLFTSLTR